MAKTVEIEGQTFVLGKPGKFTAVLEVTGMMDDRPMLGIPAIISLVLEAGGKSKPLARWAKCKGPVAYGEAALEGYLKLGLSAEGLGLLFSAAYPIAMESIPDFSKAETKAKNSEAGEEVQS